MKSNPYPFLIITAILLIFSVIVYRAAFRTTPPPILTISEEQQSVGEAYEGESIHHRFSIVNQSDDEIQDIHLKASCSCTSIEPVKFGLNAGESQTVEIAIDTAGFLRRSQEYEDDFAITLEAIGQRHGKTVGQRFPMTGRVRRWAIPSPGSIEFEGVDQIVQGDTARAEVILRLKDDIQLGQIEIVPEVGKAEIHGEPKQKNLIYTHFVTEETGPFEAQIRISATTRDSDLPPLRIPVTGTVMPPYEFIPKQLAIAPETVGSVATRTVKLSSIKQIPFRVELPEEESQGVTIKRLKSADDDTWHEFEVSVTISEPGNNSYRPRLQVEPMNDVDPPLKLALPIQVYGFDGNLAQRTPEKQPQ